MELYKVLCDYSLLLFRLALLCLSITLVMSFDYSREPII